MKPCAKKIVTALLIALVFCSAAVFGPLSTPALANSAQKEWEGETSSGILISGDGDAPIVVDKEVLTFDIQHEVGPDYSADSKMNTVTAEYTFTNPTDNTYTVHAVFPFMDGTYIYYDDDFDDTKYYDVKIDGASVDNAMRATYTADYYGFDLEKEISLIRNDYATADDWDLDATVYRYTVSIQMPVELQKADGYRKELYFNMAMQSGKILFSQTPDKVYSGIYQNYDSFHLYNSYASIEVYSIGQPLDLEAVFENAFFVDRSDDYQNPDVYTGGEITVKSAENMLFSDLVYLDYDENGSISRMDWHNVVFDMWHDRDTNYDRHNVGLFDFDYRHTRRWYDYEITFQPHQTVINTVKAPILPSIHQNYEPTKYVYSYLLSPASTWADFKDLTINVNTPFYILDLKDGWQKTDSGYTAHYDTLPEFGTLEMTICSSAEPKIQKNYFYAVVWGLLIFVEIVIFLIPIAIIVVAIILIKKAIKRKKKKKAALEEELSAPSDTPDFSTREDEN